MMSSVGCCCRPSPVAADEIVVACALERHRLAKGALPDKLDALIPEFLARVPSDIISGEPLRYRRDADRFTLWSVGWNQTDDAGTVGVNYEKKPQWDKDKGDWVFECPPASH
jgi:hypothetical protein